MSPGFEDGGKVKSSNDKLKKAIESVYEKQFQVPIEDDINNPIFKTRYNEAKRIAQAQLNKGQKRKGRKGAIAHTPKKAKHTNFLKEFGQKYK